MTTGGAGLLFACLFGLAASTAGAVLPVRGRAAVVGGLSVLMSGAALAAGLAVAGSGRAFAARLPDLLPLSGITVVLDPLGALFVIVAALVAVPVSLYGIGYARHGPSGRTFQAVLPLFVLTLMLVPAAGSVTTFLVLWELMALTSLLLVVAEHRQRASVTEAGVWYGVMTHLGMVAILLALVLFASHAGGETFPVLRAQASRLSPLVRSTVFVLAFIGFGSKAGLVPLHVWLPRAHPEAPSQVSALMSAAMVNLGVYGILRVGYDLLGGGPSWWALLMLAVGALSALFGILHALTSSDLKRLLAYSTTENMGLILVGAGAAALFASSGNRVLAAAAMTAALLHVLNHAVFKALLFLGAGSVLTATGTRDLDGLGGLMRRMPLTGITFAVGAMAIAALPPFNGFVSEWLLLQSLVHSLPASTVAMAVTMPLAVAVVALTGGLAAATFVKALGTGFLALPRSLPAAEAVESPTTMVAGMILLAAGCVVLGVIPRVIAQPLARALAVLGSAGASSPLGRNGWSLQLTGISGAMSPAVLAVGLLAGVVVTLTGLRAIRSPRTRRRAQSWACGRSVQTARMEYTATSFAEPLQRVFDDVLRPDLDIDISHAAESRYYVDAIHYRSRIRDAVEVHLYQPVLAALAWWGRVARCLQNGSVHRYLGYLFAALLVILIVAR